MVSAFSLGVAKDIALDHFWSCSPVCLEIIQECYVTACGHSFWYANWSCSLTWLQSWVCGGGVLAARGVGVECLHGCTRGGSGVPGCMRGVWNSARLLVFYDELSAFLIPIILYRGQGPSDSNELALFLQLCNGQHLSVLFSPKAGTSRSHC